MKKSVIGVETTVGCATALTNPPELPDIHCVGACASAEEALEFGPAVGVGCRKEARTWWRSDGTVKACPRGWCAGSFSGATNEKERLPALQSIMVAPFMKTRTHFRRRSSAAGDEWRIS